MCLSKWAKLPPVERKKFYPPAPEPAPKTGGRKGSGANAAKGSDKPAVPSEIDDELSAAAKDKLKIEVKVTKGKGKLAKTANAEPMDQDGEKPNKKPASGKKSAKKTDKGEANPEVPVEKKAGVKVKKGVKKTEAKEDENDSGTVSEETSAANTNGAAKVKKAAGDPTEEAGNAEKKGAKKGGGKKAAAKDSAALKTNGTEGAEESKESEEGDENDGGAANEETDETDKKAGAKAKGGRAKPATKKVQEPESEAKEEAIAADPPKTLKTSRSAKNLNSGAEAKPTAVKGKAKNVTKE